MLNATTFTEPTEDGQRNRKRINGRCGGDDDDDDYDVDDVFSNKEDCPKPPPPPPLPPNNDVRGPTKASDDQILIPKCL